MLGECHAHIIMDGKNYKAAVALHKDGVKDQVIRAHFQTWKDKGITFVRDGGDAVGVSRRAKDLASEYGIDYRTPSFAIHKKGHYGGIVGHAFSDWKEYHSLVCRAKKEGADFIKIMISGIMEFGTFGMLTEEGLAEHEIRRMIHIAHEEGMTVMAHGNGDKTVRMAVEAGLDTLEHGNYLEQETLDLLAKSRTIWIPTLAPVGNLLGCGRFPDEQIKQILKRQMDSVRYAFTKGAWIGLGSDSGAYQVSHGQGLLEEYQWMKEAVGEEQEAALRECLSKAEERIKKEMKQ
ncbi:MAG: amidohydrolase family protein [Lachnospiraceae bacterium]|jgi:imidazolonepropionase-like amidohydrolase|nr:amidohydrolase family protein [Lachnospiraceae bacterium]